MIGANTASASNKRDTNTMFIHSSLLRVTFGLPTFCHRPVRLHARYQNVMLSPIQPLQSILRIQNSAGMSLRIELAGLRRFAARSVCLPQGKNDGIIRLRAREACPGAARFASA